MSWLIRASLVLGVVLLIPLVPFVLAGSRLEGYALKWIESPPAGWTQSGLIVTLLAADMLLPVPSSAISTFGGSQLGILWGSLVSWSGLMLGSVLGFALARLGGRPLAERLANKDTLAALDRMSGRWGETLVIVLRPIPLLAEASVLLMGTARTPWKNILSALALSNLFLAVAYSALGNLAAARGWLPWVLLISVLIPLAAALGVRKWWLVHPQETTT
jgi:uncharacterized membrane protein YdjX (TVP38/TMEM64 family)